ncbi:MAG: DUF2690 domain-containing protein [Chloroflexi bacterium]|nr:DUF2690 domain-containing protein [Chloroflexota bacterium]
MLIKLESAWKPLRILLFATLLLLGLWVPLPLPKALAACSGDACTGLYAGSAGCTANNASDPNYKLASGAKIERRHSDGCDADWTRVTNVSGASKYTAGSTRYGCTNYCSDQSVESGGYPPNSQPIANNQSVYTPMKGFGAATSVLACGRVSSSSISLPVGGTSPSTSSYCTGSW